MSTTTLLYGIFVCRRIIRYKVVLCHGGTFGGTARLHGLACHNPDYVNAPADSPVRATLQRHGRLTHPPSRPVHVSAPAYNAVADSLSAPAYKGHGRLTRPHRFTTPRPVHP